MTDESLSRECYVVLDSQLILELWVEINASYLDVSYAGDRSRQIQHSRIVGNVADSRGEIEEQRSGSLICGFHEISSSYAPECKCIL